MLFCGASTRTPAQTIAFEFAGTVNAVSDGLDALPAGVAPGAAFHGAYVFDAATPPTPVGCGLNGECADYHHSAVPAGLVLRIGATTFRSLRGTPDFDLLVRGHMDPFGLDGYGFDSFANGATGLSFSPALDELTVRWMVMRSGMFADPPALPTTPPPISPPFLNLLEIEGQCSGCPLPNGFSVQASIAALKSELRLRVGPAALSWNVPVPSQQPSSDVLRGDLSTLRSDPDGFAAATEECLADNQAGSVLPFTSLPAPGQGWWFLVRQVDSGAVKSYDSTGLAQRAGRDQAIEASGAGCS